ncbi:hypothetical protein HMSSN036_66980 [Paenibacillus macerans]|nr:hypothetical protein HMSSN036_66980 [Paenibacillus macerans]
MKPSNYVGFIYRNQFYEITVSQIYTPIVEIINPWVARSPHQLKFSEEQEQNIVAINWETTGEGEMPWVSAKSGCLPDPIVNQIVFSLSQKGDRT